MRSVWLREEGGSGGGMNEENGRGNVGNFRGSVDPILGLNLEGIGFSSQVERVRPFNDNNQMAIEQGLENEMIIGEEGKKRGRKDIEDSREMEGRDRKAVHRLRHSLKKHYPQMVFLMETKINKKRMEKFEEVVDFTLELMWIQLDLEEDFA
ncbi:hypothetical protein Gotri_028097 [Gossypium trilobum]|uniref:Uncharacterized protein n=1 Tax=Gossypium trilobum TaxID=34281 RepID=A0A7J9FHD4_9ROSI|nr:hypothetical protein [Gossypium trilobum]